MTLWRKQELDEVFKSTESVEVSGISIDSRTAQSGDLYFALTHEKDGHDYVPHAADAGAIAAVVERPVAQTNITQIQVPSSFAALQNLGCAAAMRHTGKRLAVTGSAGKTTVKEMLALVLNAHKPEKSYNNHWGVPLTLARLPEDKPYAVFEVGTSAPGEIAPLSTMVAPHVAGITIIGGAHMEGFGTLEKLAEEKLSISSGLIPGGTLVVPYDIAQKYQHLMPENTLTYSLNSAKANIYLTHQNGPQIEANVMGENVTYTLNTPGQHMVYNSLLVLGMVAAAKANVQQAAAKLAEFKPVAGRGQHHKIANITVIDESFNANPASMKAALQTFKNLPTEGRKFAILGDMLELGEEEQQRHTEMAIECGFLDGVITVGDLAQHLGNALPPPLHLQHALTAQKVNLSALPLQKGDAVLVKGSKKMFWVQNFVQTLCDHIKNTENA